jgi:uncharacterized protein (TIGR04255 family)
MKTPKRLKHNPIIEAVAEVRFTSQHPAEAIIGLVYEKVKDRFGKPASLPILQLPAALREKDPNLKHQACYRFERPGNVFLVGPRNIALSNTSYTDWAAATPLLSEVLTKLDEIKLFETIERVGLRYVNFFDKLNIFEHVTLTIAINKEPISARSVMLRTEADVEEFKVITTVTNTAEVSTSGQKREGSILDLDIVKEGPVLGTPTPTELLRLFTEANKLADKAFFGLLKEEFFARFEPEY